MGVHNLERMFAPRTIAVVGDSETAGSLGALVMQNLVEGGFPGEILAVQTGRASTKGRETHATVGDLPSDLDLVLIATPPAEIPSLVSACAERGVGGVVILTAPGRQEAGAWDEAVGAAVAGRQMRLIGPNSLGIACHKAALNATAARWMAPAGSTAFISQSNAVCTAVMEMARKRQIGFSHVACCGGARDVSLADLLDYCGTDPAVRNILLYLEDLTQHRAFMSAARSVSMVKPVIALKAGRTPAGRRAVRSHLGGRPGAGEVFEAALARAGVLPVQSFEALLDCAEFLARGARARGKRLAIVSNAGGQGVMAVDALVDMGGQPAVFSAATAALIEQALAAAQPVDNPVYLGPAAGPADYCRVVAPCQTASEIDGLLVVCAPRQPDDGAAIARELVALLPKGRVPAFAAWIGGDAAAAGRAIFTAAGVPNFDTVERAVQAYCHLNRYAQHITLLQEVPRRLTQRPPQTAQAQGLLAAVPVDGARWLDAATMRALVGCYGIEWGGDVVVTDVRTSLGAAETMTWPVCLCRMEFDAEGRLAGYRSSAPLWTAPQLKDAFARLAPDNGSGAAPGGHRLLALEAMGARAPDWTVEIRSDKGFGPFLVLRTGGCPAQCDPLRAVALPPLNRALARHWLEAAPGYRRWQAATWEAERLQPALEEALVALSQMAVDLAALETLQVQLTAGPDTLRWSGLQIRVRPPVRQAPLHLAISPYPWWQEARLTTAGGRRIRVRPIRPEDAPLLEELFTVLSPQSIYRRFFSSIKSLSLQMLARFTQIDYDREVALIAQDDDPRTERMLGVARVISLTRGGAEFAVLVGDPWQGQGIGAALLQRCLGLVKARGMLTVEGTVLAENTQMLALGRKLGFDVRRDADSGEYLLRIDLTQLPEDCSVASAAALEP